LWLGGSSITVGNILYIDIEAVTSAFSHGLPFGDPTSLNVYLFFLYPYSPDAISYYTLILALSKVITGCPRGWQAHIGHFWTRRRVGIYSFHIPKKSTTVPVGGGGGGEGVVL
jgi:hypothetical protein